MPRIVEPKLPSLVDIERHGLITGILRRPPGGRKYHMRKIKLLRKKALQSVKRKEKRTSRG